MKPKFRDSKYQIGLNIFNRTGVLLPLATGPLVVKFHLLLLELMVMELYYSFRKAGLLQQMLHLARLMLKIPLLLSMIELSVLSLLWSVKKL